MRKPSVLPISLRPRWLALVLAVVVVSGLAQAAAADAGSSRQLEVRSAAGGSVVIDPIDFLRRTSPEKTLQGFARRKLESEWSERWGQQSFAEPYKGRFYYVKNVETWTDPSPTAKYERFGWDDREIWLERDTSWPAADAPTSSYDVRGGRRRYALTTGQRDGQTVEYEGVLITPWDDGSRQQPESKCTLSESPINYHEEMRLEYFPTGPQGGFGGDIPHHTPAISITQVHLGGAEPETIERFWYALGYGFVQWDNVKLANVPVIPGPPPPGAPPQPVVSVRWNTWTDGVPEPRRPLEPDTTPCPPVFDSAAQDVAEYFFVDDEKLTAGPPAAWIAGETRSYLVKVKNMGNQDWPKTGPARDRLGVHFGTESDAVGDGWEADQRFDMHDPESDLHVPPGGSVQVLVSVTAPTRPGRYVLRHRLVRGGASWSGQVHTTTVDVHPLGTHLISSGYQGSDSNGSSLAPAISLDGEHVAFSSAASNLLPPDTDRNDAGDVFVVGGFRPPFLPTQRASVNSDGSELDCSSREPSISADGTRVAFTAVDIDRADTNHLPDVYVHDFRTGQTTWVSVGASGRPPDHASSSPAISADGEHVAFVSNATNLLAAGQDSNAATDVFVRHLADSTTVRVSIGANQEQANGLSNLRPAISGNGRRVAFTSFATNLVAPTAHQHKQHVYVRDLWDDTTFRVSIGAQGPGNANSARPSMSADGTRVAFYSYANNLAEGDDNHFRDIYVRDISRDYTARVSLASNGDEPNGPSDTPSLSGDGKRVAFTSSATNLAGEGGDRNGVDDVFVHDRDERWTRLVSSGVDGQGDGPSSMPALSGDGRRVTFESGATNLLGAGRDANGAYDVFAVRLPEG